MHARRHAWLLGCALTAMGLGPAPAAAQLQLPPLMGDGMVIQRNAWVPIRGTAASDTEVRVTFDGEGMSTWSDEDGRWELFLPPRPAGGPYRITIASGSEEREIRNVAVGDVWIASGQSNMEWPVADSRNAEAEIAGADDPWIRLLRVPRSWSYSPEAELAGGTWEVSDAAHVGDHSAVAYFFARSLRDHVDVPIGIIDNSWGGARIEPYMSAGALGMDTSDQEALGRTVAEREARLLAGLRERIGELPRVDSGLVGGRAVWADPALDDSDWTVLQAPGMWEVQGYEGLDGVAWYRRSFELTEAEAAEPALLGVGRVDDSDITWVNGREVGRMEMAWNRPREYTVPADVLRPGRNVVALRVEDTGGGGGIVGDSTMLFLETAQGRRSLAGAWRFRVGRAAVNVEGQKNQIPTILYNQMVHPLVRYPVRGVIWYQGESNAGGDDAFDYRHLFRDLIRDWRDAWAQDELPFLWVQLANYMEPGDGTAPSSWAVLRESQTAALTLPNTAQAVAIDLGEADDIHPRNKQDVGARLARAARAIVYGHDVVYSGPVYRGHRVRDDGRVVIEFDHKGSGLVARGGSDLGGFAIAGVDGEWVPARAVIEGDHVVVWSDAVPEPTTVRYAWADNPVGANLYNQEGLPATPFRTDRDRHP